MNNPVARQQFLNILVYILSGTTSGALCINRNQGVAWIGSRATLVCNREGYELIPEKTREGDLLADRAQ